MSSLLGTRMSGLKGTHLSGLIDTHLSGLIDTHLSGLIGTLPYSDPPLNVHYLNILTREKQMKMDELRMNAVGMMLGLT